MLNSDELLSVVSQVKEIGKRTGLLFREVTNIQRQSARDAASSQNRNILNQKDQTIVDILGDTESFIPKTSLQRLFWRLSTLGINHWEKTNIMIQYKENINALIAFKAGFSQNDDFRIAACALYSVSDGKDKQGVPYGLPMQIGNLIGRKKVAELDFVYVETPSEWKNVILQTIIKAIATKSGLSNGTEMILYNPLDQQTKERHQALLDIGFQHTRHISSDLYILQDLHDLSILHILPNSLRNAKAVKYCPPDESSMLGPCE